jgi:hypothetical protein
MKSGSSIGASGGAVKINVALTAVVVVALLGARAREMRYARVRSFRNG